MVVHLWRAPQHSLVSAHRPTLGSTVRSLWNLAALMTSAQPSTPPLSPSSVMMREILSSLPQTLPTAPEFKATV